MIQDDGVFVFRFGREKVNFELHVTGTCEHRGGRSEYVAKLILVLGARVRQFDRRARQIQHLIVVRVFLEEEVRFQELTVGQRVTLRLMGNEDFEADVVHLNDEDHVEIDVARENGGNAEGIGDHHRWPDRLFELFADVVGENTANERILIGIEENVHRREIGFDAVGWRSMVH